jgi:hypothetical protein
VRGEYHFNYNSASFADSEDMISTSTIQPNKTIDITTIDTLEKGNQIIDSEVRAGDIIGHAGHILPL